MLKRHSTLDSIYTPGKHTFDNKINITFKELVNLNLKQITCWSNTLSETENFLQKKLNIKNTPKFNKGIIEKEFSLWRIEPLKWWILDKDIILSEDLGSSLDLSHSFSCFYISGKSTSLLLNRYLPIDLRESVFLQASSASSAIHHVSIKLFKLSINNYYLFVPRGFAMSIWEILTESSKQFGYENLER